MKKTPSVAYFRTSSASNVGTDRDSLYRQRDAVQDFAKANRMEIVESFYDAAVSGTGGVETREGFKRLLAFCESNGIKTILLENASRFARDLAVQLTGHALLQERGIEMIPVDAPTHFTDPTPTAKMVRAVLGAVAEFEKDNLVSKLRHARDRVRAEKGRCEGRKPVPDRVKAEARRLARRSPKTGKRRSYRQIAKELAAAGYYGPSGKPYFAASIKRMIVTDRQMSPEL